MAECARSTGPWQSHPKRMLRHKAMIQCARIAFGFTGIFDEDEAQRIVERDVTPSPTENPEPAVDTLRNEQGMDEQIGRTSWRARVCQYVSISVVAVS